MRTRIEGRVHRLGHGVEIDQILASKYLKADDSADMAGHLLEGYDPEISSKLEKGDLIVAGREFGQGPLREQAARLLKSAGISCVIAGSFARPFYRSAINHGLPAVECKDAYDKISGNEIITVDFEKGEIACRKGTLKFPVFPDYIAKLLAAGGLIPIIKKSLGK